jgi:tetratricopeptide (TPR) repeat protein
VRTVLAGIAMAVLGAAQTISLDQLKHPIPPGASREYRASLNALGKGDLLQSIAHCRKAIALDPENASAHNDLGVLYLNNGQMQEAVEEFGRATLIQPRLAAAHANAAFALMSLDRLRDAEESARKALEIERTNRRAHLVLGWSMASQHRYTAEALDSLQIAAREFPEAHLAAADVLVHRGSLDGARAQVEGYLASGAPEQRTVAEAWLRFLTIE